MGNKFNKKTKENKYSKAILPSFCTDQTVAPSISLEDFIILLKTEVEIMDTLIEVCSQSTWKDLSYIDFCYRTYYKRLNKLKPTIKDNLEKKPKNYRLFSDADASFTLFLTKKYLKEQMNLFT
mmetsp:Transcript_23904/g.21248  ORF Transcript_23904/g.21248 Transcript_23904/m.21248 type:complete len:123 (-) Transcript_23904:602-970(-)